MHTRHPAKSTERPILMTSLPRSGSTWTAKIICKAPSIKLNFEPDRLHLWGIAKKGLHRYIPVDEENPVYENVYRQAFNGFQHPPKPFSGAYFRRIGNRVLRPLQPKQRVLVKSVHSLVNVEWIYGKFYPQVIILLRNPLNLIHSIYRKWPEARLGDLLSQPRLMNDYLTDFRDIISEARDPYEILATRVGAYYRIVAALTIKYADWHVITHERLCESGSVAFRELFDQLYLPWTSRVKSYLESTNREKTSDAIQHVQRISKAEIEKWRSLLTDKEIAAIQRFYLAFKTGYYEELLRSL